MISADAMEAYMVQHPGEWFSRAQVIGMLAQHTEAALAEKEADCRRLRDRVETQAAELLSLRDEFERPKCMYCSFGEINKETFEGLQNHIENDCQRHPIHTLRAALAERTEERDRLSEEIRTVCDPNLRDAEAQIRELKAEAERLTEEKEA